MRASHPNAVHGESASPSECVVVAARKALAQRAAAGDDPRNSRDANRKRGSAIAEQHRRNHEWAREHGNGGRDEAWFRREVTPKLQGYPLSAIARATGLSLAACSRIRAASQTPHPRHSNGLLAFVETGN
jgi:hypothetical protein